MPSPVRRQYAMTSDAAVEATVDLPHGPYARSILVAIVTSDRNIRTRRHTVSNGPWRRIDLPSSGNLSASVFWRFGSTGMPNTFRARAESVDVPVRLTVMEFMTTNTEWRLDVAAVGGVVCQ